MNKQSFDSPLRRQAMSYPALVRQQIECIKKGMRDQRFPPEQVLKKLRTIYISGCGDCSAAYMAVEPIMKKLMGSSGKVIADLPVHMSRYVNLYENAASPEQADSCMMMLLSVGGSPSRLVECIRRGKRLGINTIAVTNSPNSPVATEAAFLMNVNNPPFADMSPGCRDYLGTMLGTLLLTARIAELSGRSPAGSFDRLCEDIVSLADSYAQVMERMDNTMYELAAALHNKVRRVECVADGSQAATAMFFAAKVIETSGRYGSFTDSTGFCDSLNFRKPEEILTVIYGHSKSASRESIAEAVRLAHKAGRELLFIADKHPADFGIEAKIRYYVLPDKSSLLPGLSPVFDHLPTDLLAAYLSEFWQGSYFRAGMVNSPWKNPDIIAPRESQIKIVEEGL